MTERAGWILRATCLALGLCAGLGCGGGDDDDSSAGGSHAAPSDGTSCTPGFSFSCIASNGCTGLQLCGSDHLLTKCACQDNAPAHDAGMQGPPTGTDGGIQTGTDAGMQKPPTKVDAGTTQPDTKEVCGNGKDDDGDSDVDCADSDCKARSCTPKAPSGWTGPALRDLGDDLHDCAGEYPDEVASGGTIADADDADCSTCKCTPASTACSPFVNFVTSADAECGGVSCTTSVASSCAEISSPCLGTTPSYVAGAVPDSVGGCSASAQKPKKKAAEWDNHMVACAPDADLHQGGCAEGEVCAPETPFEGETCIVKKGEHDCPSGPYKKRHVYYTGITDTRSCSDCECGHDCSYSFQIYDAADVACSGTPAATVWTDTDQCNEVTPNAGKLRVGTVITGTGACAASGGDPTGDVSGKNAITLCCIESS